MKTPPTDTLTDEKREMKASVNRAPQACGCYLWKNAGNKILYVGKAQNIRARLQSYMRGIPENVRILTMLGQARNVEWIITRTENEALLLEANLVKKHNPRFNVQLKDDKRYPYLCISISEEYPQIFLSYRRKADQNIYFGPYTDIKATRKTLDFIHKIFPIRKVRQKLPLKKQRRPCVNFHIKRCLAPCQNNVDKSEYRKIINETILFLEGKSEILENLLKERMASYSTAQEYEKAAMYRDMIRSVRRVMENQVVQTNAGEEDILALACHENYGQIVIMEIRQGRLISRKSFPLDNLNGVSEGEIIEAFIRDHYLSARDVPVRIQVPVKLKQKKLLADTIEERLHHKVHFVVPRHEKSKALFQAAKRNAEFLLKDRLLALQSADQSAALQEIYTMLKLPKIPRLIECFDISHIQGHATVASGVAFVEGKARHSDYRRYRIQKVKGINDPASLQEVIDRRIRRLLKEKRTLPDLFLIDGGAPQVNAAYQAAKNLKQGHLSFVGLAKKREEIYFPVENKPHCFNPHSHGMRLLRRIRNEAHRFAVQYHRHRRNNEVLHHLTGELKNMGQQRTKALLEHFSRNFKQIEKASLKELTQISGIGPQLARQIHDFLSLNLERRKKDLLKTQPKP